jgi:hypothetical protein
MAASSALTIYPDSQIRILTYIRRATEVRDEGWILRNRLEFIDRSYMRTSDLSEEQRKAQNANRAGDPTKLQNMQVPLVEEAVETTVGFLTNVYATDYPMFKFASGPDNEDLALQWNTLVGEDQLHYGWAGQFSIAFRNADKYNFAPIEVDWCKEILYKPIDSKNGTVGLEQEIWAGNKIKAIDPYNTIYDARVPIHRCHIDGEFIGYIDLMPRIMLKRFLNNLGEDRLKNDRKAFESNIGLVNYYIPTINRDIMTRNKFPYDGGFDWVAWVTNEAQNHIAYKNMYTVVTLYARIMPHEFGIMAPRDQTPQIWKLISVNDILVYAQPLPNAHDYLPIIIAQSKVDGLDHQTKSPAESQMPFQEMTSALWNAKLQSTRRRTTDRMLYNPLLVDPDHINSPNPSAKIPIRPTAYGRKLEEAIYKIPFDDDNSQYFIQEANGIAEWAMRANGNNRPMLGQFQKGNKLQDEWTQTMANGSNRERTKALLWHTFFIQPIQVILKSNYLLFTPAGERYNRKEAKTVEIDPTELRKAAADFVVGDGLLPIQKQIHSDVMQGAMQTIAAVPGIGQAYDLGPMFSYLMKVQGVDGLSQFEKSKEDIQYEQALSAWSNAAALLAKNSQYGQITPEQMKQILGPVPQPPKSQQQQTPPNQGTSYAT